ncbi:MAG: flavodoxin family protein [Anaerolineaceae bacterium]|nr:flavodoxin family protein [Anaerolineaceae bacterium]
MKTLVIYDSFFGNTEKIAQAIGQSLETEIIKVQNFKPEHLEDLEILIVGSPTRAFSPSPEIKSFLKALKRDSLKGVKVAAFDTRISLPDVNSKFLTFMVKLFGYADKPIIKALVKKGGESAVPSEGFFVKESEGPLANGELERAVNWAKGILTK